MKLTASGTKTSGQMEKINDVVGVWATAVVDTEEGAFIFRAPKILVPCAAAATAGYDEGEKVYFDVADAEVNETASGNTLCGFVIEDSALADETVLINLQGDLGIVT